MILLILILVVVVVNDLSDICSISLFFPYCSCPVLQILIPVQGIAIPITITITTIITTQTRLVSIAPQYRLLLLYICQISINTPFHDAKKNESNVFLFVFAFVPQQNLD